MIQSKNSYSLIFLFLLACDSGGDGPAPKPDASTRLDMTPTIDDSFLGQDTRPSPSSDQGLPDAAIPMDSAVPQDSGSLS